MRKRAQVFVNMSVAPSPHEKQVKVWRAVLDNALLDLMKGPYNQELEEGEWEDLIQWFDQSNNEFVTVCTYAQVPVQFAHQKIQTILVERNLSVCP